MGRPKNEPETRVRRKLDAPEGLGVRKRKLWEREFSAFPPGFFVPADLRTMLLYLDWIAIYDKEHRAVMRGKGGDDALNSLRQTAKTVMQLQRALRMMPSTRSRPEQHAALANAPTIAPQQEGEAKAPWERMMENAGTLPKPPKRH